MSLKICKSCYQVWMQRKTLFLLLRWSILLSPFEHEWSFGQTYNTKINLLSNIFQVILAVFLISQFSKFGTTAIEEYSAIQFMLIKVSKTITTQSNERSLRVSKDVILVFHFHEEEKKRTRSLQQSPLKMIEIVRKPPWC